MENDSVYKPRFHIILHQPEIPPNTGAVGRTCVALQAKLWLVRPLGFQLNERTLKRAGLDYWQFLNWEIADHWEDFEERIADQLSPALPRFWMFSKTAEKSFTDADFRAGDCLVFGSETAGLPPSMMSDQKKTLRIPMFENVRSLNLSCSVAVAGYEVHRQLDLQNQSLDSRLV